MSATLSAAMVRPAVAPMSSKRSGFFQGAQMAAPRVAAAPVSAQRARRAVAVEARSAKAAGAQIQVDVEKPLGLVSGEKAWSRSAGQVALAAGRGRALHSALCVTAAKLEPCCTGSNVTGAGPGPQLQGWPGCEAGQRQRRQGALTSVEQVALTCRLMYRALQLKLQRCPSSCTKGRMRGPAVRQLARWSHKSEREQYRGRTWCPSLVVHFSLLPSCRLASRLATPSSTRPASSATSCGPLIR